MVTNPNPFVVIYHDKRNGERVRFDGQFFLTEWYEPKYNRWEPVSSSTERLALIKRAFRIHLLKTRNFRDTVGDQKKRANRMTHVKKSTAGGNQ